jgi:hypothetical protein
MAEALRVNTEPGKPVKMTGEPYVEDFERLAVEVRALGDDLTEMSAQMCAEHGFDLTGVRVLGALMAGCKTIPEVWTKLRAEPSSVIVSLLELAAYDLIYMDERWTPLILDAGRKLYEDLFATQDDRLSDDLYHEFFDHREIIVAFVKWCRRVTQETSTYFALPADERGTAKVDIELA